MEELLRFLRDNEVWIFLSLGVLVVWWIRRFVQAWDKLREAAFGLEREAAQSQLNGAATMLLIWLFMVVAEFTLVYIVAPTVPGALPIPTATLNLLTTPSLELLGDEITPLPTSTIILTPEVQAVGGEGCTPEHVDIFEPRNGDTISGVVKIRGTADIPNFGFYKYEIARPGETVWLPLSANNYPVREGDLGEWVTSVLPPGDYMLRLIVTDNEGNASSPCVIQVRVIAPTQ